MNDRQQALARLASAITGERADWHRVEVDPRDIAAALAASDPAPAPVAPCCTDTLGMPVPCDHAPVAPEGPPEPMTIRRLPGEKPYPFPLGHVECGYCQDYGYTDGFRAGREVAAPVAPEGLRPLTWEDIADALSTVYRAPDYPGMNHGDTARAIFDALGDGFAAPVAQDSPDPHKTPHPLAFHDDCVGCLRRRIREITEGAAQKARDLAAQDSPDPLREAAERLIAYLADSADVGGEPGMRVVSWVSPQVRDLRAAIEGGVP